MSVVQRSLEICDFSRSTRERLLTAYSEQHRHYHNINHIWHALNVAEQLSDFYNLGKWMDEFWLHRAVWFHDIVYTVGADDNEHLSAVEYVSRTGDNDSPVSEAIRDTKTHDHASSFVSACLLDADLSGLGADWEVYEQNGRNVRAEYGKFTDEEWAIGREKFLTSMLERKTIFHTSYGARWERQAQANIDRELRSL